MSRKTPMPNHFLAIVDKSQLENVDYAGEDKFDMPNSGILIKLSEYDKNKEYADGVTYKDLLNKKVYWAKYAEADAFFPDDESDGNVVFIALDKLRGYEN